MIANLFGTELNLWGGLRCGVAYAFVLGLAPHFVSMGQNSSTGFVHPPKQFTQFVDESLAEPFGGSLDGNCNIDLTSLERGVTGKWKVYTVKDKTPLFENESNYSSSTTIDFRTALSVVEVGESMLKVEFVDRSGGRTGWVEACDVLLWNKPIARNGGFPRRVIALSQLRRDGPSTEIVATNFKRTPAANSRNADLITGLEVLYIMKEVKRSNGETYYLLSGSANSSDLSADLKGWLPASQVTAWDTRVAYWENHSPFSQQEYKNEEVPLFFSQSGLSNFLQTGALRDTLKSSQLMRKPKSLNRMLHLESSWRSADNVDENLLELYAVMSSGDSDKSRGELNKLIAAFRKKMRELNIHFVIDATASMEKNVEPIRDGLQQFMVELTTGSLRPLLGQIDISVGASVYRGVEDGEEVYELVSQPLPIENSAGIDGFMADIADIKFKSHPSDRSLEESVFLGISESLKDASFKHGATNFLIVIGDAGDDGRHIENWPLVGRTDVLQELKDIDVDVLFLQSTNGHHKAFDAFIRDAMFIIDGLESSDGKLEQKTNESLKDWMIVCTQGNEETSLKNEGMLCLNVNTEKPLASKALGEIIADEINHAAVRNNTRLREFIQKLKGGDELPEGYPHPPSGYEYSVKAWANKSYYNHKEPAFAPYVYMEYEILEEFKSSISNLVGLNPSSYYRELESFLTKYSSRVLGLGKSHPSVQNMTMGEVWDEAFDLPFAYVKLGGVKIKDVQSLNSSANAEVKRELVEFQSACTTFSSMATEPYEFNTSFDDSIHGGIVYWIPGEFFPGMKP